MKEIKEKILHKLSYNKNTKCIEIPMMLVGSDIIYKLSLPKKDILKAINDEEE